MFTFVVHVLVSCEVNSASPVPKYSQTFQVAAPTWGGVHMNFPRQKCFWFFQRHMNALEVATSLLDATKILQTGPLKTCDKWRTDVWMFAVRGKPVGPECCIAHQATVEFYQMFHFKNIWLKIFCSMFLLLSSQTQRGSLGIWIRASLLAISYLADEQRFSASRSVVVWTLVIHFAPSSHPHIVRKLFWFKTIWCTRDATLITNPPLSKWISPPWNNRNTNTTFNLSQTKWSSQYPKITPSTSLLVITWTSKYLTLLELLSENLWPCAGFIFFFFAVSGVLLVQLTAQERFSGQLAYSASQLLVMAGVATSHCYPEGAPQHHQTQTLLIHRQQQVNLKESHKKTMSAHRDFAGVRYQAFPCWSGSQHFWMLRRHY